jgi:hypothetical protein
MRTTAGALAGLILLLLAGCASTPGTADIRVQAGMSREDLLRYFGKPLRIEAGASGEEDWYYEFIGWKAAPTGESGNRDAAGERIAYVSVGLSFSQETTQRPIHLSAVGVVVGPVPKGKIVTN